MHNLQISSGIVNKIADLEEFQVSAIDPAGESETQESPRQIGMKLSGLCSRLLPSAYFPDVRLRLFVILFTIMDDELTLRIVLEKPPAGVDFGLQKGRGSDYETIQTQRSEGRDLRFQFTVRATTLTKGSEPNFLGPFVQGPTGERFVYIDIGTYAGQTQTCWSRRLKIPLRGISREMVDRVLVEGGKSVLETHVPGTGKDGGPSCATVKPFAGWHVAAVKRD